MISPTTGPIVSWPGGVVRKVLVAAAAFESTEPGKAMCAACAWGRRCGHGLATCFGFAFSFRRRLIHAKCLTMPAMHSEGGTGSPLMCRVFLEIPKKKKKNSSKGFLLDTTPPAYVKVKAWLPGAACWGKKVASFSSVSGLALTTGFQMSHCPDGQRRE